MGQIGGMGAIKADDTLAAIAAMISCYLDTVREQRHCTHSSSNRCKQSEANAGVTLSLI